ncbi:5-guanidino-2-oxopentanoate decarboxylase [Mesorhizobium sp. LHD-90]|uniref:5-guanidino-2-oxopentanoate decarboxylase n=1 Tax=Mesorhizobium sp. LHD-90 TaxID=3071414 RepID=UPI0027E2153A|nr:5-guanidino-2-oxopentanoate decarboxylase [Mesorhizobium sp. LHD-90]MDQ6434237.1 5-guanidino-2-oxopentanoate decarboxylase [Mesorhizobium sp. LHD-90]
MTTIGEALISLLERHGVDTVFGIPGVHTVELYRGLAGSKIRHITPRHEQGAAFMADGFARASGKPGVAFVITGPGLTNAITAVAQARADSVPMLVVSGVNATATLGKGFGYLHELPDQRGMMEKVALSSTRVESAAELQPAVDRAFALFRTARPGPVHIEIPLDVMGKPAVSLKPVEMAEPPEPDHAAIVSAARLLAQAVRPVILAGGGASRAEAPLRALAERLDAPVVLTANARGLLHRHPLVVPASPSLKSVRELIDGADLALAVGTEFGPTDYDMYADGGFALPANLVRIDIDAEQLDRHPADVKVEADSAAALEALLAILSDRARPSGTSNGGERAETCRDAARAELARLGPALPSQLEAVEAIRDALPGALIVGDSTQPVYAGNLYYDHDRPGGWFNAATGYGALGYGPPAAIGAALAGPGLPVVCLTGDGGFQFTLPEIAAAVESKAGVVFVVWNNRGYREIEVSMRDVGVEPVGVSPAPPDFCLVAEAYGLSYAKVTNAKELASSLRAATAQPAMIEYVVP